MLDVFKITEYEESLDPYNNMLTYWSAYFGNCTMVIHLSHWQWGYVHHTEDGRSKNVAA